MKNQRGVTLVELLVLILLMGAILAPISTMIVYALEKEKEISIKNDVQREGRFIMEYITEKMRNKNVYWYEDGAKWVLGKYDLDNATWLERILIYENNTLYVGTDPDEVLLNEVTLTLIPGPFDKDSVENKDIYTLDSQEVKIEISKLGEKIKLSSNLYFNRY